MANQFKKDKIDFDVYERRDPDSQVNWAKAAQDITKTFEGIRDARQGRKDQLEAMITEQQNALNDIGSYDSPTLQQVALDASNDSANKLNDQANLMRRGLIKPHEMQKFKANQSAGWTQFKKNAEGWNNKYNEYTKRTTDGTNSKIEQEIATQLSGFNNLKNLQFMSNAETGEMSYARTDDEGNIIPGESVSINQMTNLLNQKVDAFDLNASVLETKGRLGTIITATIDPQGIRTDITTEEMSRAESDYFGTEAGKETLKLEAAAMISVPMNAATMLVTNVTMADGSQYITDLGGAKHDEFAKANPGKPNPYVALRYDGNQYVPDITEDQMGAAQQYAENKLKNSLDIKETAKSQKIEKNVQPQPSAASIAKGDKDDAKSSKLGDYITMLTDPDPVKRSAIEKTLRTTRNDAIDKFNAKVSNEEDKLPLIENITKGTTSIATQADVDAGRAENIGDQVITNRKIILSDGKEIDIKGTFTEQTRILEAVYDPDNQLTTDDIERLAKGRGFDLDTEITSTEDEGRTSKAAFATPNYNKELQIGDSTITAVDYIDAEFGYGSGGNFNSTVDTTEGIAGGFENLIKGAIDPAILDQFNKTPGMEFSIDWQGEASNGDDIIVFNFGGETYEIGNTDNNQTALYDMNGQDLWKDLQKNLLNPAIKKLNKGRTGGGNSNAELD